MDVAEKQIIINLLDEIYMKIEKNSKEKFASDDYNNLTITEAKTIYAIGNSEPKTMKQISELLYIAPNTATVAVERLVAKKLAVREPSLEDRRQLYVRLTSDGLKVLEKIIKISIEEIEIFLSPLSDAETLLFKNILEKINNKM
jgi:DNA-binding MarR family transcriptional regulator